MKLFYIREDQQVMEDLTPGFRFYPTEEELISFYLHNKLEGKRRDLNQIMDRLIPVLDIYDFNPWDLPQLSGDLCRRDGEQCFFFNPRREKEVHGGRPNRLTTNGYWKATGSPAYVYSPSNNSCIGVKRIMVFYKGRVPNGEKTEWKMNEYKAIQQSEEASSSTIANSMLRQEFSLCRVYKTSKCRRAFDRRPVVVETGKPTVAKFRDEEARTTHQNSSVVVDEKSKAESSSQQDHDTISQIKGSNMQVMAIDTGPMWDWEDLYNWDYI